MTASSATRKKPDPVDLFFEDLGRRQHEPLLQRASGTVRFDISDGEAVEHWQVAIRSGDVRVSRKDGKADATIRAERPLFAKMVTGRANALAAVLRGAATCEGDLGLVMLFQRLFPGPPSASGAKP